MAGKKSGLGRGLDALFPEKTVQSKPKTVKTVKEEKKVAVDTKKSSQQETSNGERMMKISMIEPNREQPRKKFDEDALQELSESIKQDGMLEQIRTVAMDFWASLEHDLRYKSDKEIPPEICEAMLESAAAIADIDVRMQEIFKQIQKLD